MRGCPPTFFAAATKNLGQEPGFWTIASPLLLSKMHRRQRPGRRDINKLDVLWVAEHTVLVGASKVHVPPHRSVIVPIAIV
jgi:hypothetical protein